MSNSYRIRTEVGKDKAVSVYLDQDFEYLEILSLKILQSQIYTRPCSDYGVVIGRVSVNNGFGIPNAKVSVFIPLTNQDELNPIVSDLYPYRSVSDLNEDGYRYNLLPYTQQHGGHTPTGTFFEREDVLVDPTLIEVFDKYYKYTARTNESGDYMIFGVPLGSQLVHIDIDLSDIGEFSLFPQDLVRMGRATESQIAGINFRNSTNLGELPQIVSINKNIVVEPLWGQEDVCNIGITRCDFDLTDGQNIRIEPTAIFMGSIFSDTERMALKRNCKPRFKQGELCNLVTGPGEILAIRQTIYPDINGRPALELYPLESGGQVIDDNGTWVIDVPMNLDYVVTNEFGQQVISNDPTKGIPTKGKYRFKVKWNQSPNLTDDVKRGYFLVPNVREYGWNANGTAVTNLVLKDKSYAFSIDWDDYADIPTAIKCDDTFYEMKYNKVYTVSQLIDQFRRGSLPNRFVSIKNILDDNCESENNRFPTNDVVFRTDIIYILYLFVAIVFRPVIYALIFVLHTLYLVLSVLKIFMPLLLGWVGNMIWLSANQAISALLANPPLIKLFLEFLAISLLYTALFAGLVILWVKLLQGLLKPINLPIMLYDSCEFCKCKDDPDDVKDEDFDQELSSSVSNATGSGIQQTPLNSSGLIVSQLGSPTYNQTLLSTNPQYNAINLLFTGKPIQNTLGSTVYCSSTVPGLELGQDSTGNSYYYTTDSLTIAERINLFNTKAKYFDTVGSNNPGGGVNRIKVSFDNGNQFHNDNIVFLLLTPDSAQNVTSGDIITFQNPNLSSDLNVTAATFNQFSNNSITGTSVTTSSYNRTIEYANVNGIGNTSVVYTLPAPNSADTAYHKYPTDLEYFQVITAMTYSDFDSMQGATLANSLNQRYIKNFSYILEINDSGPLKNDVTPFLRQPFVDFQNYQTQVCLMLVRGVDPYSTKQTVIYQMGRIFGYTNENAVVINGSYKLNEPIKSGFKNVAHNIPTNIATDPYSNLDLYYDTFTYQPDITKFSGFNSNLPSYYSILDNNFVTATFGCACPLNVVDGSQTDLTYGRKVINPSFTTSLSPNCDVNTSSNSFVAEHDIFSPGGVLACQANSYQGSLNNTSPSKNRGYFVNEIVEGGSLMIKSNSLTKNRASNQNPSIDAAYISFKYPLTTQLTYSLGSSNRKLVMRSDRLPASTQNTSNCGQSYLLQNNQSLGIFKIGENGVLPTSSNTGSNPLSVGQPDPIPLSSEAVGNDIINSLNSCNDSVPLGCYDYTNNEFYIKNRASCFYSPQGKIIFENGCYIFITKIIKSIPTDLKLLTEWLARMNVTFAACRNVFSHLFTNNWINGTLYAFAFKNSRIFNGQNQPTGNKICTDVVHFDTITNNFYYRSSPYHSGTTGTYFCAEQSNDAIQKANLKYPTTLMDLGPKTAYIQELVMSDDFDGYVVKDLKSTTFNDVADLLNIFILSRLANSSFNQLLVSGGGGNIFNYFNERGKKLVDGDYPQMISINSELGVAEFEGENYPPNPAGQDPIYFSDGTTADGIFGVFFSSETQVRDFISPKRTIVSPNVPPTNICAYSYFSVFSQEVPLYQWEIKPNQQDDNIFGSQLNTWYTEDLAGGVYHSSRYQSLDRINPASRYFRTVDGYTNQSLFLGHIYGWYINPPAPIPSGYTAAVNSQDFNAIYPRVITVGAPFHFYFGLKKGKSAWDRFAQKWIGFEIE